MFLINLGVFGSDVQPLEACHLSFIRQMCLLTFDRTQLLLPYCQVFVCVKGLLCSRKWSEYIDTSVLIMNLEIFVLVS